MKAQDQNRQLRNWADGSSIHLKGIKLMKNEVTQKGLETCFKSPFSLFLNEKVDIVHCIKLICFYAQRLSGIIIQFHLFLSVQPWSCLSNDQRIICVQRKMIYPTKNMCKMLHLNIGEIVLSVFRPLSPLLGSKKWALTLI